MGASHIVPVPLQAPAFLLDDMMLNDVLPIKPFVAKLSA
jgi:hypothetical protein